MIQSIMFDKDTCIYIFQGLNNRAGILKLNNLISLKFNPLKNAGSNKQSWFKGTYVLVFLSNILTGKQNDCLKNTIAHNDRGGWLI